MKEKVVLAYSGGLDTTAVIPWLKETFGYDVICCCINCGQGEELDGLEERAKMAGASKLYIEDIIDDFCDNYIMPCVKAHAVYENKYLLGTAMARPAIAKKLVEIARKEGAVAICHGATGKGNDQIRFELGITALAPDIKIIAPARTAANPTVYIPRIFHKCSECAITPGVLNPTTNFPVAILKISITTKSPPITDNKSKFFIIMTSRIPPAKHILDF